MPSAGLDFASFGSDVEAAKAATLEHTQQSNSGSGLRAGAIQGASSVGLLLNGAPWSRSCQSRHAPNMTLLRGTK